MDLRQSRPELSLRRFARYAGVSYWQLRDFEKSSLIRHQRSQERDALREQVKQVAFKHPTYGYRFLYQELPAQGERLGLHRVRELLGELGLNPTQPRKTRRPSPEVRAPPEWPAGRRIQIDATRSSLADGVCWVYHVLDVEYRVVLASKAVRGLSMQLASAALDEGVLVLRSLGIHDTVLVQSDGGSDFTKSVAPRLGVVQDGVFGTKTAQVPVSTAFIEIAVGDARLGKRHASSSLKPLLLLLRQIAMHWVVLRKPREGHGLVADMPY